MTKTRILLGSALALSLAAFMAVVTKPQPHVAQPAEVAISQGGAVRIEARPSHGAVHADGSEFFAEFTVTLPSGAPSTPRAVQAFTPPSTRCNPRAAPTSQAVSSVASERCAAQTEASGWCS